MFLMKEWSRLRIRANLEFIKLTGEVETDGRYHHEASNNSFEGTRTRSDCNCRAHCVTQMG